MASLTQCKPFTASRSVVTSTSRRHVNAVICAAAPHPSRREVLSGVASLVAITPLLTPSPASAATVDYTERQIPVDALNVFQKQDIVNGLQARAEAELSKILTADDAPTAVRLLIADAAAGGVNASIILSDELSRPENSGLKPFVDRLAVAKKAIDAKAPQGQAPISWADTIVLAVKVAVSKAWTDIKVARAGGNKEGSADRYGAAWPVSMGRVDATSADAGRVPAATASPDEVLAFFKTIGLKAGETPGFGKKSPFWERQTFVLWTAAQPDAAAAEAAFAAANPDFAGYKKKYDVSRKTFTRTDYEVDFVEYSNKLAAVGAKFDKEPYYFPLVMKVPKKL